MFGTSVAIDGETVVVGAYRDDGGSGGGTGGWRWRDRLRLPHERRRRHVRPGGQAGASRRRGQSDKVGYSVAIDGATIVVGAPGTTTPAPNPGSAYVFEVESGWWDYFSSDAAATRALPSAAILLAAAAVLAARPCLAGPSRKPPRLPPVPTTAA